MNINYYKAGALASSALLLLTGCIDDNYDLSDIDTTTQLKVNDLVVPINLKAVTLDNVIDVDENDPDATIKYVTLGDKKYFAIEKHGDFHANPTTIRQVDSSDPDHIQGIEQELHGQPVAAQGTARRAPGSMAMKYDITEDNTDFTYNVSDVDETIQTIQDVRMFDRQLVITVTLTSRDIEQSAESVEFRNLRLTVPEGMNIKCDAGTVEGNVLSVPSIKGSGNKASLVMTSDGIDFTSQFGADGIVVRNQAFTYTANLGVLGGELFVYPKTSDMASVPTSIHFMIDYDMSSFRVDEFTGRIDYAADIEDIDPVNLSGLPDFLAGDETNLIMHNPQLTLNVNNPAGAYRLGCSSGLTINSIKDNVTVGSQTLPGDLHVGFDKGSGPYVFVIAPHPDEAIEVPEFGNTVNYEFPGLSYILAGEGLPDQLKIELASASLPEPRIKGDAYKFPLGRSLEDVDGQYTFMTLLALDDGSKIVYEKTDADWDSEDLKKLAVSKFTVSATADTDLPCGVKIWARPVDSKGNDITLTNPDSAMAEIPAEARQVPFSISMEGDIRDLDGIHFIATAENFNGSPLTPDQNIKLDNIKVRVTGTYTTDF